MLKIDKTKYKTELCKNWAETGHCRYGKKCQFAHGNVDQSNKEPQNARYKSKLCKQFYEKNHCPYGNRCLFRHEQRQFTEIHAYHHVYSLNVLELSYLSLDLESFNTARITQSYSPSGSQNARLGVFGAIQLEEEEKPKVCDLVGAFSDLCSENSDSTELS